MALPNPLSASSSSSAAAGGTTAAAAAGPSSVRGLSARGLVSLERAEGILQRVIDTVNEQALQISSLSLLVQTLMASGPEGPMRLPSSLLTVESRLAGMEARLAAAERAIQVPGVDPSVTTIGEVVSTNGVELNAALDSLGKKANEARCAELEKAVAEVYDWAGARELVERLEESSRATRAQVQGMEAALACKVDRAEVAGMDAMLARLKAFSGRIDALETAHAEGMHSATGAIQRVDDKTQAALGQLDAAHKAIDGLEEKQAAWRIETLELLKEVEGELATTAPLSQLDAKLDARAWDREWRLACERLDAKADAEEARALRKRLAEAEEELVRLGRESELYSRFVQWFYAHGQAHEHNLQTIDRTLGRLAKDSLERQQQRLAAHRRQQKQQQQQQQRRRQHPNQHDSSLLTSTDEEVEEEGGGEEGQREVSDLLFSSPSSSSSAPSPSAASSEGGPRVAAVGGGGGSGAWRDVLGGGPGGQPPLGASAGAGEEGEETMTLSP